MAVGRDVAVAVADGHGLPPRTDAPERQSGTLSAVLVFICCAVNQHARQLQPANTDNLRLSSSTSYLSFNHANHAGSPDLLSQWPAMFPSGGGSNASSSRNANPDPDPDPEAENLLFSYQDDQDHDQDTSRQAEQTSNSHDTHVNRPSPPKRSASQNSSGGYRPPLQLKSTASSKEAEFDADSDELGEDEDMIAIESSSFALPHHNQQQHQRNTLIDRIPIPGLRASVDGIGNEIRQFRDSLPVVGVPGWDGEGLPDWLKRGAGVFDGTVNMANSILGAGIVGLPYSMRESGFIAGLVLLVGLSFLTDWTIRLIVLNAKLSGRTTYIEIMEHCFGGNGKAAVSIFQFAFAFGGMCAFCVSF